MTDDSKEPMISRDARPTAVDYDAPIADWRYRDLVAVITSQIEILKPEQLKPEHWKPEQLKPERFKPEHWKPEQFKPERFKPEQFKPEKEMLKPEKEYSKPEKPFDVPDLVDQIAQRVVEVLVERELIRRQ